LKVNEFVSREVVDKLMKMANPVWQVILGLSRYPVFSPQNTPNTRKRIFAPVMPCFRVFRVFRGSQLFGDKIKEVIAAPRASCLLLRLGDLGALAVSLGDLNA